jgi:hypothetical protein
MFGVPHIKVDVVNGFDLQEIRFLGHRTGRGLSFGFSRSHSASLGWSIAVPFAIKLDMGEMWVQCLSSI